MCIKIMGKINIVLYSSLLLVACGGGGADSHVNLPTQPDEQNSAPSIVLAQIETELQESDEIEIGYTASDPDGDTLTVSVSTSNNALQASIDSTNNKIILQAKQVTANSSVAVDVTVTDGKASKTEQLNVSIIEGSPVISLGAYEYEMIEFTKYSVSVSANDPQQDTLTMSVTTESELLDIDFAQEERRLNVLAKGVDNDSDFQTIKVTAIDSLGNQSERDIKIKVLDDPNTPPVLTFEKTSLTIKENSSTQLSYTVTDAENDAFTLDASSSNAVVQVQLDEANNLLLINAGDVSNDESFEIEVSAMDSKGAVTIANISLTVEHNPNTPPTVTINDKNNPELDYLVIDRTRLVLPVSINDAETSGNDLSVSVAITDLNPAENFPHEFSYEWDQQNSLVTINMPEGYERFHDFKGDIYVSDGDLSGVASFNFTLEKLYRQQFVKFNKPGPFSFVENAVIEVPYNIISLDNTHFEFGGVYSHTGAIFTEDDPVTFEIDEANHVMKVTTKAGSAGLDLNIRIEYTFREDKLMQSTALQFSVREPITEHEKDVAAGIVELERHIKQSMELELVGEILAEAALLNGFLSDTEYDQTKTSIYDTGRRLTVEVAQNQLRYFKGQLEYSYYADVNKANYTLEQIEVFKRGLESTASYTVPVVNDLLEKLRMEIRIDADSIDSYTHITDEELSRFINNPTFGEYQNGQWQFFEAYRFLAAATAQSLNTTNF